MTEIDLAPADVLHIMAGLVTLVVRVADLLDAVGVPDARHVTAVCGDRLEGCGCDQRAQRLGPP